MNSAARHCKCGKKNRNKREKSIEKNLIDFLEKRGLYHRGQQPLNFKSQKNIDRKHAA
jgi:hypothetical protein